MTKTMYQPAKPRVWAEGSEYGPLQTNGIDYLCPECGGYGYTPNEKTCSFCKGEEVIPLDDNRITESPKP